MPCDIFEKFLDAPEDCLLAPFILRLYFAALDDALSKPWPAFLLSIATFLNPGPDLAFTSLVCLFFVHWSIAIVVGLIDYIAHWHIDYSKSKVKDYFGVKVPEKGYWFLSSIDQGLHYLTYYAIVLLIT